MKANPAATGANRGVKKAPLTPREKLEAIYRVGNGESKASVARSIQVPESTLRGWCKNRDKIEQQVLDAMTPDEREIFAAKRRKLNVLDQQDQATDLSMKHQNDGERSYPSSQHSTVVEDADDDADDDDDDQDEPMNLNNGTDSGNAVSFRVQPEVVTAAAAPHPVQHVEFSPNSLYSQYRLLQSSMQMNNFPLLPSAEAAAEATAVVAAVAKAAAAVAGPFWFGGVPVPPRSAPPQPGTAPAVEKEEKNNVSSTAHTPSPSIVREEREERPPPSRLREVLERLPNRRKSSPVSRLHVADRRTEQRPQQPEPPVDCNAESERREALQGGQRFLNWLQKTSDPRISKTKIFTLESLLAAFDA